MFCSWEICYCVAYNSPHFDNDLEREQDVPYDVKFEDEPRKEIYVSCSYMIKFCTTLCTCLRFYLQFGSAIYYTKPTGDPDVKLSTPDEYLSHLEEFVGASLGMAETLEDTM